jgi:hypothetical protein
MTIRVTHIFAASMANGISSIVTPISHPPTSAPEIRAPPDQGALERIRRWRSNWRTP